MIINSSHIFAQINVQKAPNSKSPFIPFKESKMLTPNMVGYLINLSMLHY